MIPHNPSFNIYLKSPPETSVTDQGFSDGKTKKDRRGRSAYLVLKGVR